MAKAPSSKNKVSRFRPTDSKADRMILWALIAVSIVGIIAVILMEVGKQ